MQIGIGIGTCAAAVLVKNLDVGNRSFNSVDGLLPFVNGIACRISMPIQQIIT